MFREHHQQNGHEFEQIPGDGGVQRGLACYSPWDHTEMDTTWQLNNNKGDNFQSRDDIRASN